MNEISNEYIQQNLFLKEKNDLQLKYTKLKDYRDNELIKAQYNLDNITNKYNDLQEQYNILKMSNLKLKEQQNEQFLNYNQQLEQFQIYYEKQQQQLLEKLNYDVQQISIQNIEYSAQIKIQYLLISEQQMQIKELNSKIEQNNLIQQQKINQLQIDNENLTKILNIEKLKVSQQEMIMRQQNRSPIKSIFIETPKKYTQENDIQEVNQTQSVKQFNESRSTFPQEQTDMIEEPSFNFDSKNQFIDKQ